MDADDDSLVPYSVAAVEALYEQEHSKLLNLIRGGGVDSGDIDAIAQECWTQLFKQWHRADAVDCPQALLFSMARRRSSSWRRSKGRKPLDLTGTVDQLTDAATVLMSSPDFTDGLFTRLDLIAALLEVPVWQRQAVALRFSYNLTVKEAAALMGCTPYAVQSAQKAGLLALRSSPSLAQYSRSRSTPPEVHK